MYLFFRLFDDSAFVLIILLAILYGVLGVQPNQYFQDPRSAALYSLLSLEVFYDILMTVNKYWILQRVSVYIAIVLFGGYFLLWGLIWENSHRKDDKNRDFLLMILFLLLVRFVVYLLEIMVDIYIDMAVHNVLTTAQRCKIAEKSNFEDHHHLLSIREENHAIASTNVCKEYFKWNTDVYSYVCKECSHTIDYSISGVIVSNFYDNYQTQLKHIQSEHPLLLYRLKQQEIRNVSSQLKRTRCDIPDRYEYLGSFSAWSFYSVHSWGDLEVFDPSDFLEYFSIWWTLLIVIPAILTGILVLCVSILGLVAIIVMWILVIAVSFTALCCQGWCVCSMFFSKKHFHNYWREMKKL
jgi:hypothetical protein